MTISEFSTDDEMFTMSVEVLDRNTAIGIIETLRDFDSIIGVSIKEIEDKTSRVSEEQLEMLEAQGFTAVDLTEEEAKKPVEDKNDNEKEDEEDEEDEEEPVLVIEGNENADDDALSVKLIGTYYLTYDTDTNEEYYVRKYVSFTISCVYAPAEEVVIENNVTTDTEEEGN
jgi:hypothetical protein